MSRHAQTIIPSGFDWRQGFGQRGLRLPSPVSGDAGEYDPLGRLATDPSVSVAEQVLEDPVSDAETLHLLFARFAR